MRAVLICVILLVSSLLPLGQVYAAEASDRRIGVRIEEGLQWLFTLQRTADGRTWFEDPSSPGGEVSVPDTAHALTVMVMYAKTYSTSVHDDRIRNTLSFLLDMQDTEGGDFVDSYNPSTGEKARIGENSYHNAATVSAISFSAFHMRLARPAPQDAAYYAGAVAAARTYFERVQAGYRQAGGGWLYRYPDGRCAAELDTNGLTLASLLYLAAYHKLWGDPDEASSLTQQAEEQKDFILAMQERDPNSWGFGGFYQDGARSIQDVKSNALAVLGLTTYLRLIDTLVGHEAAKPAKNEVRAALVLWESDFFREVVDGFNGPISGRSGAGRTEYPKTVEAAAASMIAFVEIWVVHGDSRFLDWSKALYAWLTGGNEKGLDLQTDVRGSGKGFVTGFDEAGPDLRTGLRVTALATLAMLYGNWIDIPELQDLGLLAFPLILGLGLLLLRRRLPSRS